MMQLRPKLRNAAVPLAAMSLLTLGWTIGATRAQDKAAANEEAQAEFAKIRGAVFGTVDKPDAHPSVADIDRLMAQYGKATRDPKLLEVVTLDALADQKQGKFGSIELQILQTMQNQRIIALLEQMAAKPGGAATHATGAVGPAPDDTHVAVTRFGGYPGNGTGLTRFGRGGHISTDPPEPGHDGVRLMQGVAYGRLTARGNSWIEVTSVAGKTFRYVPSGINGGYIPTSRHDDNLMARAEKITLGDYVTVQWHVDNHVRVDAIDLAQ